jgi:hypothetical protein
MVQPENVLEVSTNWTSEQWLVILKNTGPTSKPNLKFEGTRGSHTKTGLAKSRGFVGLVAASLWLLEFFVIFGLHISGQGTPMKIETLHPFRQALRSSQSAVMMTLSDFKEFDGDKSSEFKEPLWDLFSLSRRLMLSHSWAASNGLEMLKEASSALTLSKSFKDSTLLTVHKYSRI